MATSELVKAARITRKAQREKLLADAGFAALEAVKDIAVAALAYPGTGLLASLGIVEAAAKLHVIGEARRNLLYLALMALAGIESVSPG